MPMTLPPRSPVSIEAGVPGTPRATGRRYGLIALECAALLLALYLPCRFLVPLTASYHVDWVNHEWLIGYFGEYFIQQWTMPWAYNTQQLVGMPYPVFYGTLVYPLLGPVSSIVAPGVVMRVAAAAVFLAQYLLVTHALVRLKAPRYVAHFVALIVVWAIYPLTNLYNRSALTEFIATGLLVCALSLMFLLIETDDARRRRRYASGLVFCLTLSAGSHPITAVYGGAVFVVLAAWAFMALGADRPRRTAILRALRAPLAIGLVCLLPWIVAMVRFGDAIDVRHAWDDAHGRPQVVFHTDSLDHWLTRFSPVPWDRRVAPGVSLDPQLTPYLDTQVNVPLLVVFVALAAAAIATSRRPRERSLVIAIAFPMLLFMLFTWLSLSPSSYELLPATARMIQFGYRNVTYQNLSLLIGVFMVLMALRSVATSPPERLWRRPALVAVFVGCLLLSTVAVLMKGEHIMAAQHHDGSPRWILGGAERRRLISLPAQFYGWNAYSTARLLLPWNANDGTPPVIRSFEVDQDLDFGAVSAMKLELAAPSWVLTNVLTFPWNVITVDGTVVSGDRLRSNVNRAAVLVGQGAHTIAVELRPDASWRWLRAISLVALFGWCFAPLVSLVAAGIRAGHGAWRWRSSSALTDAQAPPPAR
jgi:hypothetical protein